ncbi:nuclear transport factor 2 family protein [Streptomyces sp. NPDC002476]|uniref:nuclear transport factor 2 family protein n=1 Tax=Streptomyces sp. NPDC002476 TaxID=3364648 RepID=UPI0036CBE5AF
MNQTFDLKAVLTELLHGDEATEPLEDTLDRLLTPDFVQRINGRVHQRSEFAAHVREMRARVADGGELRTLQLIGTDSMAAGRFLFRMVSSEGAELTFESHLFARVSGGRAESFVEVARQVATDDDKDLLTEDSLS